MNNMLNNSVFLTTKQGSVVFGEIRKEHNIYPANIYLALGNKKNGYVHIEERHGLQILNAGFSSVIEFVEYVATNFTRIKEGQNKDGKHNGTYLLQVEDRYNNTLYIELCSSNGLNKDYWVINSGGVFKKTYGKKYKTVWSASEVQKQNRHLLGFCGATMKPKKKTP